MNPHIFALWHVPICIFLDFVDIFVMLHYYFRKTIHRFYFSANYWNVYVVKFKSLTVFFGGAALKKFVPRTACVVERAFAIYPCSLKCIIMFKCEIVNLFCLFKVVVPVCDVSSVHAGI